MFVALGSIPFWCVSRGVQAGASGAACQSRSRLLRRRSSRRTWARRPGWRTPCCRARRRTRMMHRRGCATCWAWAMWAAAAAARRRFLRGCLPRQGRVCRLEAITRTRSRLHSTQCLQGYSWAVGRLRPACLRPACLLRCGRSIVGRLRPACLRPACLLFCGRRSIRSSRSTEGGWRRRCRRRRCRRHCPRPVGYMEGLLVLVGRSRRTSTRSARAR